MNLITYKRRKKTQVIIIKCPNFPEKNADNQHQIGKMLKTRNQNFFQDLAIKIILEIQVKTKQNT